MGRLSKTATEILNELHTERLDYTGEYIPLIDAINKLAEYEDAEEQGLLVKLPYKAGERVWILYNDKLIEENYVASIQIGEKYDRLCFADGYVYTIWNKDYEKVKKWVYTSKAEAEKALAEMGDKHEV